MKRTVFESVIFDLDNKNFEVLNGSEGVYSYLDVKECKIKAEDAKFKGKTAPFTHCILSGPGQNYGFLERSLYIGIKVTMKDESIIAIYVSKEKTTLNSDLYNKAMEEAKEIQGIFTKAINKYSKQI